MSIAPPLRRCQTGARCLVRCPGCEEEPLPRFDRAGFNAFVQNQYAGQLCTYGVPSERKPVWIVRFEDADRGDAVFHDEQEAIDFWLRAEGNWNCTLLTTVRVPQSKYGQSVDDGK